MNMVWCFTLGNNIITKQKQPDASEPIQSMLAAELPLAARDVVVYIFSYIGTLLCYSLN